MMAERMVLKKLWEKDGQRKAMMTKGNGDKGLRVLRRIGEVTKDDMKYT